MTTLVPYSMLDAPVNVKAYAATELVLKNDGVFGGASHGIRVNSAGTLSTSAYTPTAITGSVAALLSSNLPAPATLLL